MRNWIVVPMALALAACGGGDGAAGGTPGGLAAEACKDAAESPLAASMRDAPNGEKFLTAPITIEPGLTSEVKQIVECTVRFSDAKPQPDVVGFVFNW